MAWVAVGSAAVSAVGSLLGARSQKKAEKRAAKERLALMQQQHGWDVEDRDAARKFDLEDRTARQALLNPYAKYFKGERLPAASVIDPANQKLPSPDLIDRNLRDSDAANGYRYTR